MAVIGQWKQYWRVKTEASFGAANPENALDWNIGGNGGGANGWMDLPLLDADGLQPKQAIIFPSGQGGARAMNRAAPVAGAYLPELGNIEMPVYPELIDRFFYQALGGVARAETAGAAAKSSIAFASLATLDTQPNGTEMLKFTIASSTASSAAAINIIQSATTQETITIGTSASSVDGVYYSKGAYDGSTNAITFTVAGTVTAGTVVVAGVDYVTNTFTAADTNPTLVIEQGGRQESLANSEYFSGLIAPTLVLSYDRNTPDNLLTANVTLQGRFPAEATAGTYGNEVVDYYKPIAGWTGTLTQGGSAWAEVVSANITLQTNNQLYQVSSGNRQPSGAVEGQNEVFGQMTILPIDGTQWDNYNNITVSDVHLDFLTPFYVVDTTPYRVLFEFTKFYIEDYARARLNNAQAATLSFRTVYDSSDGISKITTRCRMPV